MRLALIYATIALYDDGAMPEYAIVPSGFDARWAWLRRRLRRLAVRSATVRHVTHILDLGFSSRVWASLPAMRREVRRLDRMSAQEARRMAEADGLRMPPRRQRRPSEDLFRAGRRHPARRIP